MKASSRTNGLSAIHPGEFLRETLDDMALTQAAFAEAVGVSPLRVSHWLKGDRPVTAELALRLGHALGQSPAAQTHSRGDPDRCQGAWRG